MLKNKKIVDFAKVLCLLTLIVLVGIHLKGILFHNDLFDEEDFPSISAEKIFDTAAEKEVTAPKDVVTDEDENYDVDLVYLWCDGNDPKFREKKNYWLEQEGKSKPLNRQATADGRFEQVDELKYSLRSAELYLPWVRHIYIVTYEQVPPWLNTQHPKITVVDHSEIIPEKYLPVFSSNAIETSIQNIPGLVEHFLLANDDTFINRPLTKGFFFYQGEPIVRMKFGELIQGTQYRTQLVNTIALSEKYFGKDIPFFSRRQLVPHHNIDAYLKSDYAACANQFEKEYRETLTHRFRTETDVQRLLVSIWSVMHKHAWIKVLDNININKENPMVDSLFTTNTARNYGGKIAFLKPGLFCINDGELSTPDDRIRLKEYLELRFPDKSQFEL